MHRLMFAGHVLDLDRGTLLRGNEEIALRPKTFNVLRYLAEHPQRLVSKDELFAAVWPNLVVTDDTLVQSIGELRRALGEQGGLLIRNVPRRGYRFEAAVSPADERPDSISANAAQARSDAAAGPAAAHLSETAERPTPDLQTPATPGPTSRPWFRRPRTAAAIGATALVVVIAAVVALVAFNQGTERGRGDAAGHITIAVMPFANQSGDAAREYFADGLAQDLISALGQFGELTVMSWNAVHEFKTAPASPADVAHRLGVQYQVEGSVAHAGDRVRVVAHLVDAQGRVLRSTTADEQILDLFALEDRITTQIAGALALRIDEAERTRTATKPAEALEAYDLVLRARPALQRPTRAGIAAARALLRRALEIDPASASAQAALARTYHIAVALGWAESPTETLARAEASANAALRLDPRQSAAHATLGRIHIFYNRYEEAGRELDLALAANPSDAEALAGRGNVLMWLGRTDAAIDALERALRIDPELNPIDRFALGLAYYLERRYPESIEQGEANIRLTSAANFSRIVLAAAYAESGRADDAARVAAEVRRLDPGFDATGFGSKFLKPTDLAHLREGLRKAGLYAEEIGNKR